MAKSFNTEETVAGVLSAINMVATEMGKENPNEKRAGQVAMAAIKVVTDSEAIPTIGDMFDLTPIKAIEGQVVQVVDAIPAPPVDSDNIPF